MIDRVGLLDFVGNELVALVEEQDAELLLVGERHCRPAILQNSTSSRSS
jgi:hypothetical protein